MNWKSVRVVLPATGRVSWLLLGEDFEVQPECREFVVGLMALDRSTETVRAYVPRVGRFLNWCVASGVEWRRVGLADLARFKFHLEQTETVRGTRLSGKSVNAVLIAVVEFLRFCAARGHVDAELVAKLHERRFLRFAPSGFDRGERGEFSTIRARALRAAEVTRPPETLTGAQATSLLSAARSSRDQFLIMVLLETAVRIGEALGMRREDLHLLPSSLAVGCAVAGPHVHVRPRLNNVNGARVKSGRPRIIPVTTDLVEVFRRFSTERELDPVADGCDYVFVNRHGPHRGRPMSYSNAKQMVEAAGRRAGFRARPHMLRHTAATRWVRAGSHLDVVQTLLGHASQASTAIYLHASDEDLRAAVERTSR